MMKLKIQRIDQKIVAEINGGSVEVKDYKIKSSADEGTELTITVKLDSKIEEFDLSATP